MTGRKAERTVCQESLSIRVGRFLLSEGLHPASWLGQARPLARSDSLGILRKDESRKLLGLIKRRRVFLGVVWFRENRLGATEENWVFEVYGRTYIEFATRLTEKMSSLFNVKIALRLVREQSEVEAFPD